RRSGLGGSDIAAIFGVSPYTDEFALWLDKRGELEDEDNATLQRGRVLEPALVDAYAAKTGTAVAMSGLVVGRQPWMLANPDGLIGVDGGWEGKTANRRDEWGEDGATARSGTNRLMPVYYALQVAWYLEVLDREWWDVTCAFVPFEADKLIAAMLRRGIESATVAQTILDVSDLRHYRITRDRSFGYGLVARAEEWWRVHVVEGKPPAMTGSDKSHGWLQAQHPEATEPMRAASADELDVLTELRSAQVAEKEAKARVSTAKARAKAACGDAEGLWCEFGRIKWSTQAGRTTIDADRLRDERPEVAAEYTKTDRPSRVLRPTWRKR
ncbi:YqaJ viral recombinase family protein, partial [Candidatus Poribacteria bacterium]|nr:YqaJ viral recombinase family protein [Candidatus Poribacteria bacterium]